MVIDHRVLTGKPVIRGNRLTVQFILGLLAHGATMDEIIEEYPGLTREDILACLLLKASGRIPDSLSSGPYITDREGRSHRAWGDVYK
ncbi:MAG: DUF433 domain-containing protein [Atribacterota bacterium]